MLHVSRPLALSRSRVHALKRQTKANESLPPFRFSGANTGQRCRWFIKHFGVEMIRSRLGSRGPSSARVPSFPPSAGEKKQTAGVQQTLGWRDEATAAKVTPTPRLISVLLSHAYTPPDKRAPPEHISTINIPFRVGDASLDLRMSYRR